MKSFIIYLVLIVGIVIISCFTLQRVYFKHFTSYPATNKLEAMMRLKDTHYDIAFIGSSRVEKHIDCEIITQLTGKSCANFSYPGLELMDIEVLLAFFKKNNVTYDTGYIQVDYSYAISHHSANYRAAAIPYMHWDIVEKSLSESSRKNTILKIPFAGFMTNDIRYNIREIATNIFVKKPLTYYDYNIIPREGEGTRTVLEFPTEFKKGNTSFERLINSTAFKQEQLHFFISPYCPNVPDRDYHTLLVKEYPFIKDYTAIFDDTLRMYRDCGHLNKRGAKSFTNHIVYDLLNKQ